MSEIVELLYKIVDLLEEIKTNTEPEFSLDDCAVTTDTWFKYPPAPEVKHES